MTQSSDFKPTPVSLDSEPLYSSPSLVPAIGSLAVDFGFTLTNGTDMTLAGLNSRAPVLLNFIKGTWCPFCQAHLHNLRTWQAKVAFKNISLLVISNENLEVIRAWARDNEIQFLFGSAKDANVFSKYGVDIEGQEFSRPATFLIDRGMVIRMAHTGTRDDSLSLASEKEVRHLKKV